MGEPHLKPEETAFPRSRFASHLAAHQACQPLTDRQSQPRAAVHATGRGIRLLEGIEQSRQDLGIDPHTRVLDLEADHAIPIGLFEDTGSQNDPAVVGEFDGIAGEIEQGLTQPRYVPAQPGRARLDLQGDAEPLGFRRRENQRADLIEQRARGEVAEGQLKLAGLDLREVQDVVEEPEQVAGGRVHLVEPLSLHVRHALAAEQIAEPEDGVHRGSDLVGHVADEGALGNVGHLRRLLRPAQFARAFVDEPFQILFVLQQLGFQPLAFGDVLRRAEPFEDFTAFIEYRHGPRPDPAQGTVRAQKPMLQIEKTLVADGEMNGPEHELLVIRMNIGIEPSTAGIRVGHGRPSLDLMDLAPIGTHAVEQVRTGRHQGPEALFAVAQRGLHLLVLRHVAADSGQTAPAVIGPVVHDHLGLQESFVAACDPDRHQEPRCGGLS
ncbi:hypothetical protein D779_3435 [Imhoffiella purpurea]|uniref:Uncharacterized protein n=1 Tax=Imhoffiella purpurea TaxID=1249627 RepID=W9VA04_9GAMM|nr:hypothetical protein D779_3435 [Imhoffiella purpurea]